MAIVITSVLLTWKTRGPNCGVQSNDFAACFSLATSSQSEETPIVVGGKDYGDRTVTAAKAWRDLVDLVGFEPTTSSMPWKRAPNCATGPHCVPKQQKG